MDLIQKEQDQQTKSGAWEPRRYLIQTKWWSKWCDYVNFDTQMQMENSFDVNLMPKPARESFTDLRSNDTEVD